MQGLDYAYTLQGWLKAVNGNEVTDGTTDMGGDGRPSIGNTARDAIAFGLHYYQGDYKAIGETTLATGKLHNTIWNLAQASFGQLYNGNIAAITEHNSRLGASLAFRYRYDQLNRLVNMDVYSNPWGTPVASQDYREQISYDPNGNILTYLRNGATADRGLAMDNITYQYNKTAGRLDNNKLLRIVDAATNSSYTEDLKTQTNNYEYDAIGNLVKDLDGGVSGIIWTVYGKIAWITKGDNSHPDYSYKAIVSFTHSFPAVSSLQRPVLPRQYRLPAHP